MVIVELLKILPIMVIWFSSMFVSLVMLPWQWIMGLFGG